MRLFSLKIKEKNRAFTLVETLVAVMIFSVAVMAVMTVLASGLTSIDNVKKKMMATYLAQEGVEYVRNLRDTRVISDSNPQAGWNGFISDISNCINNKCKIDQINNSNGFTIYDINGFSRNIQVKKVSIVSGDDAYQIISTVSWAQGSGTKSVQLSEILFNWIQ